MTSRTASFQVLQVDGGAGELCDVGATVVTVL